MLFMTIFGKFLLCCLSMSTYQTESSTKSLRIMKRKYNNQLQKSYSSLDLSSCSLTDLKNLPLLNLHSKGNFLIKSIVCNNSNSTRKPLTNYKVSTSSIKGFQSKTGKRYFTFSSEEKYFYHIRRHCFYYIRRFIFYFFNYFCYIIIYIYFYYFYYVRRFL